MRRPNVDKGVTRLPEADDELVRALYADYGAALLAYVTGLVGGDRQRAEDIVQETLLRAWRHPEVVTSQEQRSARAWLFTVARNLTIDSIRARAARPPETFGPTDAGSHDGGLESVLTRFEMLEALGSLAPQHRDVIVELFYRDHSVAQAGRALGVPEGTIKSRCHYAMRALRVLCQERGLVP